MSVVTVRTNVTVKKVLVRLDDEESDTTDTVFLGTYVA